MNCPVIKDMINKFEDIAMANTETEKATTLRRASTSRLPPLKYFSKTITGDVSSSIEVDSRLSKPKISTRRHSTTIQPNQEYKYFAKLKTKYPTLQRCTIDDNTVISLETLQKIAHITKEGPLVSRYVAVTLFDKLAKKSSSLSVKIIPVVCFTLQHGSDEFKQEVSFKKTLVMKLKESSLKCQGTLVHDHYKVLLELIESENRRSLLPENYESEFYRPKCMSFSDIPTRTKGSSTRDIQIDEIVSPERLVVSQITTPSCVELLPSMVDIWSFAKQYKQLNQRAVNVELLNILQGTNVASQIRALSVLDYLSHHFAESCKGTFTDTVDQISRSGNIDLSRKAKKILNSLLESNEEDELSHVSPQLKTQTSSQDNLSSAHMKRSYDKILPTATYRTPHNRDHTDEALLDLSSPCSSTSGNITPPHSFRSFFSPPQSRRHTSESRRSSANSTDNLLDENT